MAWLTISPLLISAAKAHIPRCYRRRSNMSIRQTVARFAAYQRTVRELNQLDDRELRDLGINRGEIRSVARRAAA
jgi:uncharacterized protein YjiS (DUF1127 family)